MSKQINKNQGKSNPVSNYFIPLWHGENIVKPTNNSRLSGILAVFTKIVCEIQLFLLKFYMFLNLLNSGLRWLKCG